eukprot:6178856-Pleurochrysis_carterae.AAC.4
MKLAKLQSTWPRQMMGRFGRNSSGNLRALCCSGGGRPRSRCMQGGVRCGVCGDNTISRM